MRASANDDLLALAIPPGSPVRASSTGFSEFWTTPAFARALRAGPHSPESLRVAKFYTAKAADDPNDGDDDDENGPSPIRISFSHLLDGDGDDGSSDDDDDDDDDDATFTTACADSPCLRPAPAPRLPREEATAADRYPPNLGADREYDALRDSLTLAELDAIRVLRERLRDVGRHPRFETRSDELLARFLRRYGSGRAANGKPASAKDLRLAEAGVRAAWAYRLRAGANDGLDALEARLDPALRVPAGWIAGGIFGKDRDGTPIYFDRFAQLYPRALSRHVDEAAVLRYALWRNETMTSCLEACSTPARVQRLFFVVIDAKGLAMRAFWPRGLKMFKAMSQIDEDYWPDRLKRCLIVNAPWLFAQLWTIVRVFLPDRTRERVDVVSSRDTAARLAQYIAPESIPGFLPNGLGRVPTAPGNAACQTRINAGGKPPSTLVPSYTPPVPVAAPSATGNHLIWQYDAAYDPRQYKFCYAPLTAEDIGGGGCGGGAANEAGGGAEAAAEADSAEELLDHGGGDPRRRGHRRRRSSAPAGGLDF